MRTRLVVPGAATALAVVVASTVSACSPSGAPGPSFSSATSGPLAAQFEASARANGVPRDVMIAIAQTEGALDLPARRQADPTAAVVAAGPLQLRHGKLDTLARGAALMHTTELALREDADLALEAAARVLGEVGARTGAVSTDLATWRTAIEEMGGYADDAHRADYARRVFALLARGGTFQARDGEKITLAPHDLPPSLWLSLDTRAQIRGGAADYPDAEWFPTSCSNKCDSGRGGANVQYVVIHDTEGSWDSSVATLQNDPQKSVQYIVGTDGKVGQFVAEGDTAWHAGNYWFNQRSVGIEHVGYANKPFSEAQYAASAKLVKYLTAKYHIAKDRAHVIGHDQIPNGDTIAQSSAPCSSSPTSCQASKDYGGVGNHRDPGVWEWATYMARLDANAKCNDASALLTCSNDGTHAFRCKVGKMEVFECVGGCHPQTGSMDDECDVKASSGGKSDNGGGNSAAPGLLGGTMSGEGDGAENGPDGTGDSKANAVGSREVDGGCSAGGARLGGGRSRAGALGALAALGLAVLSRRRRRR